MNLELEQIYQSDGNIDIVKVIKIVSNRIDKIEINQNK